MACGFAPPCEAKPRSALLQGSGTGFVMPGAMGLLSALQETGKHPESSPSEILFTVVIVLLAAAAVYWGLKRLKK